MFGNNFFTDFVRFLKRVILKYKIRAELKDRLKKKTNIYVLHIDTDIKEFAAHHRIFPT